MKQTKIETEWPVSDPRKKQYFSLALLKNDRVFKILGVKSNPEFHKCIAATFQHKYSSSPKFWKEKTVKSWQEQEINKRPSERRTLYL